MTNPNRTRRRRPSRADLLTLATVTALAAAAIGVLIGRTLVVLATSDLAAAPKLIALTALIGAVASALGGAIAHTHR